MKTKLLLLHGALGSSKQFEAVKILLDDAFEVYTLNFEGHGGVGTDKAFSIPLFTENVVAFMMNNQLEQVNIFGYSMGGYVALNLALHHPNKVGKIVTLGTKFNWDEISTAKEVKMLNPAIIEIKVPHFAQKLKEEHAPLDWKIVMKKTAAMMIGLSKNMGIQQADFKKIQQEVLVGIGDKDRMVTYEESESTAQLLPNGKVIRLAGFRHPIDKIDSKALAKYIEESFKK